MNWREHLRMFAIIVNGLVAMTLIGVRGWWMSVGLGVPMIIPPSSRLSHSPSITFGESATMPNELECEDSYPRRKCNPLREESHLVRPNTAAFVML